MSFIFNTNFYEQMKSCYSKYFCVALFATPSCFSIFLNSGFTLFFQIYVAVHHRKTALKMTAVLGEMFDISIMDNNPFDHVRKYSFPAFSIVPCCVILYAVFYLVVPALFIGIATGGRGPFSPSHLSYDLGKFGKYDYFLSFSKDK